MKGLGKGKRWEKECFDSSLIKGQWKGGLNRAERGLRRIVAKKRQSIFRPGRA